MAKKVFETIDEEVFKGVDSLKTTPQFNQVSQAIEGLPEEAQKYVNQALTYFIAGFPLLILFVFFILNYSARNTVGQKEYVIEQIKKHISLKNQSRSIGNQLVGTQPLEAEDDLRQKLGQITREYALKTGSLSVLEHQSKNAGELTRSTATVLFQELSTPKFVGLLTEFMIQEKAQIENLKIIKDGKKIKGEFTFTHYGRKGVSE